MFTRIGKAIYKLLPKKRVGKWLFVTGVCLVSPSPLITVVAVEALIATSVLFIK